LGVSSVALLRKTTVLPLALMIGRREVVVARAAGLVVDADARRGVGGDVPDVDVG